MKGTTYAKSCVHFENKKIGTSSRRSYDGIQSPQHFAISFTIKDIIDFYQYPTMMKKALPSDETPTVTLFIDLYLSSLKYESPRLAGG